MLAQSHSKEEMKEFPREYYWYYYDIIIIIIINFNRVPLLMINLKKSYYDGEGGIHVIL